MRENAAFDFAARAARRQCRRGGPIRTCRPSPRCPTAATRTTPTGTATSSTARRRRAGSTASRIWPRPARSRSISPPATPCIVLRAGDGIGRRRARRSPRASAQLEAARRSRCRRSSARPSRSSCGAAAATRSSPAIRGSPTGDATRSSRCADWCSRADASTSPRSILLAWAATVSEGMLPNRFPDHGERAGVQRGRRVAVVRRRRPRIPRGGALAPAPVRARLTGAVDAILDGYARGTRFGIRMDDDGLLACGVPGVQLTWMDARVGDRVITPRIGKPVEVQALWINALRCRGGRYARDRRARAGGVSRALLERAPRAAYTTSSTPTMSPGRVDASVRPNQIFAVGGLPFRRLDGRRAAAVVAAVERELLTPMGLRSLAPSDPRLPPALRRRRRAARRRLPPGHGLAVAHRRLRRRVARCARRRRCASRRSARRASWRRCWRICDVAGLGPLSARSPTATRRTRRAAARSRRGRWAN